MEIIATYSVCGKPGVKFIKGPKPNFLPKNQVLSKKTFKGIIGKAKKQNVILESKKYIEYQKQNPQVTYSDIAKKFHTNKVRVCRLIQLFQNLTPEIKNFISAQNNPDFNWHFSERKLRELTALETNDEKLKRFEKMVENFNHENNSPLAFQRGALILRPDF